MDGDGVFETTQDYKDRKKELADLGINGVSLNCDPDACELCASVSHEYNTDISFKYTCTSLGP